MIATLRRFFLDPRIRDVDVDSVLFLKRQKEILTNKPVLKQVFQEFYELCDRCDKDMFSGQGRRVEIGAGISFFKKYLPELISADIKMGDDYDMVFDAQRMPFRGASIRSIFGINCFHHLPAPEAFLRELDRVLVSGGGCVLIEPYFGFVARRFYRRVFATEHFNPGQIQWATNEENRGVMNGANQALSYIVFMRDRKKFESLFPTLEIVSTTPIRSYLRYLLSGGLNFRQLAPQPLIPPVSLLERAFAPVETVFALHYAIVIRKRA